MASTKTLRAPPPPPTPPPTYLIYGRLGCHLLIFLKKLSNKVVELGRYLVLNTDQNICIATIIHKYLR